MSSNGRLTAAELTPVQGAIQLANTTAEAWFALRARVVAEGLPEPRITTPYGGYRSFADQVKAHGKGHHQYKPGTSVHGYGRCVDVWNWAAITTKRLDALAAEYGFRRTISNEPWHYQHDGTTTAPAGEQPTEIPSNTTPTQNEDDDMIVIIETPQAPGSSASHWWVQNVSNNTYYHIENNAQLTYLKRLGIKVVQGQQDPQVLAGFTRV